MTNQNNESQSSSDDEQFTADIIQEMNELNSGEGIDPVEVETPIAQMPPVEEDERPPTEEVPQVTPIVPETPAAQVPIQSARVRQIELENEQLRQQQIQNAVDAEVQRYQTDLTAQGVPEDSARYIADQQRQSLQNVASIQMQAQNALADQQGKMNAAMHYSALHGVSPQALMMYDSPQGMEAAAKQQKQINDLQAEVAASKRASVVSQMMDNSSSSPNMSPNSERLLDSANSKPSNEWTELEAAAVARVVNG